MKNFFVIFTVVITMTTFSFGQNSDEILEEGKLLYHLEKASWYSTDIFLEKFSDKIKNVDGYLSYYDENNHIINIFYETNDPPFINIRFEFDSVPKEFPLRIDTLNHTATEKEIDLITIRQDAINKISENKNGFFTFYENTSFNLIPLIHNEERRVFILTGTSVPNIVPIGNDYLLIYDKKNKLKKKKKIHNSLVPIPYSSGNSDNHISSTMHSHVLSDLITSTDICTLLLYKDYIEWKQHFVISKKYVSIFDIEKEKLFVMKRQAWQRIYEHPEKK